jgi:peptidoglycan/xylan/chitin deacetylase (PgdA/CDA1 family)
VALTFDDGPHPEGTPAVLEELDRRGARATFFLVGEQVERRPALAAEIAAAGHGIALHGHLHRNLLRVAPRALASDLKRASTVIAEATGAVPELYRPPYGIFSPAALVLARRRGLRPLLWSRWGRDWRARATPASIAADVTRGLEAGDVLLLHDADFYSAEGSWRRTVAALPPVLDEIERLGLRPVVAPR